METTPRTEVPGSANGPVSVRALFRDRAPELARRLPPGSMRLLELLVCERTVNAQISAADGLSAVDFCELVLESLDISVVAIGEANLREATRPVVCANHPTGGVEGLALIAAVGRALGTCRFPANDLLRLVGPLAPVIVPVRHGRPSRDSARAHAEAYSGGDPILVFPAGVTARVRGGALREFAWRANFVTSARRTSRTIVPVAVSGRNSRLFYAIHAVRRVLGVRLNLEMMMLVRELFRHRGDQFVIRFLPGRPADVRDEARDPRESDGRTASLLRREVERAASTLRTSRTARGGRS